VIWQINPFDQWGVEYGKQLNKKIFQNLNNPSQMQTRLDCSTQALIQLYKQINTP